MEQMSDEILDICIAKKDLPNVFINSKGKNSSFSVEKPGRHCLNQVIKINIIDNKTINILCLQV